MTNQFGLILEVVEPTEPQQNIEIYFASQQYDNNLRLPYYPAKSGMPV